MADVIEYIGKPALKRVVEHLVAEDGKIQATVDDLHGEIGREIERIDTDLGQLDQRLDNADDLIDKKADITYVDSALSSKADAADVYTKEQSDVRLNAEMADRKQADVLLEQSINELSAIAHTHSNKALLDSYDQANADIADAVVKRHVHSDSQVAAMESGITAVKVSSYDAHLSNVDKHVTADDKAIWYGKQDKLTNTDVEIQSAVIKSHTHSNKTVLDGISSTNVSNWDNAVKASHSHANKTELDKIETGDKAKWDSKQGALSNAQMTAVNSGITESKVTGYDSHLVNIAVHVTADERTKWDSKQDKLTNTDLQIQDAVTKSHVHSNKTVLDGISSTSVTKWDNAATDSHVHSNKIELDKIETGDKAKWDSKQDKLTNTDSQIQDAVAKAHNHSDAQKNAMNSGITSVKVSTYDSVVSYIPPTASTENQLADKAYVDYGMEQVAARYLSADANGNPFSSYAEFASGIFYYDASETVPTKNDYVLVNGDETHENAITRYWYTGLSWAFQYIVNNSPLNSSQLAAINSGITDAKVITYDSHVDDTNIHVDAEDKANWYRKYDKPDNGIPQSDLSNDVQLSLGKADTAVQHNELDEVLSSKADAADVYTKDEVAQKIAESEEKFMNNHGLIYDNGVVYFG